MLRFKIFVGANEGDDFIIKCRTNEQLRAILHALGTKDYVVALLKD